MYLKLKQYWHPRVLKALVELNGEAMASAILDRATQGSRVANPVSARGAANIALKNLWVCALVHRPLWSEEKMLGLSSTRYCYAITSIGLKELADWEATMGEVKLCSSESNTA